MLRFQLPALLLVAAIFSMANQSQGEDRQPLRVGIIGLDTSHAIAFPKILHAAEPDSEIAGVRVVAVYPQGSRDIESSVSRVPGYIEQVKQMEIDIVDSIPQLLERVDVVLLETNDGRPHLEQAIPVIKAGKPMFVDKPTAGSLTDVIAIYELAKKYKSPVFSSSGLRFGPAAQEIRNGKIGPVLGADAYSPCSLEPTHPDLFWYGIHGVELLYTVMGTGCESVRRVSTPDTEFVIGTWSKGRVGTFRGIRAGKSGYGGTAFGTSDVRPLGGFAGYGPLVVEIVRFFRTKEPPVEAKETIELYAFMEAADESKRQDGAAVSVPALIHAAREKALAKLADLESSAN